LDRSRKTSAKRARRDHKSPKTAPTIGQPSVNKGTGRMTDHMQFLGNGSAPWAKRAPRTVPNNAGRADPTIPSNPSDGASAIAPPPAASEALALLQWIAAACLTCAESGATNRFELSPLDPVTRSGIADMLGKGAVVVERRGPDAIAAQESRFAGIWLLSGPALDRIEVAPIPSAASKRPFAPIRPAQGLKLARGKSVSNAPALHATLRDRAEAYVHGSDLFVVDLSVLPHTEEDLMWLDAALGEGVVTIVSRGDTNCRMTATAVPNLWRVQFFDSVNLLTLDSFEVTQMPEIATAAAEDLAESGARLVEALETPQ